MYTSDKATIASSIDAESRERKLVLDMRPESARKVLLGVALGLALASSLAQVARYGLGVSALGTVDLFDANREANIPTLFSTLALITSSLLAALVAVSAPPLQARRGWFPLAGGFALAATDEAVGLHELLNAPLRLWGGSMGLSYPWVLPGIAVAAAVGLFFRSFMRQLPTRVKRVGSLGALVFVGGAVGIETLENLLVGPDLQPNLASGLVGTLSELFEMAGVVLMIEALLLHLALTRAAVSLVIQPRTEAPDDPQGDQRRAPTPAES